MPPKAVMKILTGPPGTGKTFRAAREAVHAIDPTVAEADILTRHAALIDEGRIVWVTFHPSYTYEDFVEGIRPIINDKGDVAFKVVDGVFKRICRPNRPPLYTDQILLDAKSRPRYKIIHVDPGGVVVKSNSKRDGQINEDGSTEYISHWMIDLARNSGVSEEDFSSSGADPAKIFKREETAKAMGVSTTFFTNGSPMRAVIRALREANGQIVFKPSVLVIDEINRSDLSRVFGELITLLELDKRAGEPEEKRITLPHSGEQFTVPATLSIIGTMNTADRSLAVLDYALRRRFTFEEVAPNPLQCAGNYGGLNLGKYLTWMNRVVTALLSRDNRVGHVDLMQDRLEAVRNQEGWPDGPDGQLRAVAWTLRHKIAPLLLEYFHEDWRRASRALGQMDSEALMTEEDFSDIAGLDADLDLRSSYVMEDWWDPVSNGWDPDRFRRYMLAVKDVGSPPAAPATTVAASAPPAPSTPTSTTAAPLPASDDTGTPTDAAPAEQNDEDGADEDQSAQE